MKTFINIPFLIDIAKRVVKDHNKVTVLILAHAPLLLVYIAGIAFFDFVWTAIEGNVVLNSLIIFVANAGAALILYRLAQVMIEHVTLRRFWDEAKQASEEGQDMAELIELDWVQGRLIFHYLDQIASTGGRLSSRLDQTAIEEEQRSISSELHSRLELPNFLVGFMVAMGLLGTFIGLLETLTGISHMLDGMAGGSTGPIEEEFTKLVGQLRHPLAGMGIAFSASLFGLIGSLMLGLMLLMVRRYSIQVAHEARLMMNDLTERVSAPVSTGPASPRGGAVSDAFVTDAVSDLVSSISEMQDMFLRSQESTAQMTMRIDNLGKRLEQLAQSVEENVAAVKTTNNLLGFGPRMKETNEQMLAEFRNLNGRAVDQNKVLSRLADIMSAVDQKLATGNDNQRIFNDNNGNMTRDTFTKIEELTGLMHSVNDRGQDLETRLDRKLQALSTSTTAMASGIQQLAAKLGEINTVGQNQLSNQTGAQQVLRDSVVSVVTALSELQEQMKKIEEVQVGGARHLWDIKEGFAGINTSLESLEQIRQSIVQQGSILEVNLNEMRSSQRTAAKDLQRELRDALRGLVAQLSAR
jgi:biopolymer transport protein ExbB/TolQ